MDDTKVSQQNDIPAFMEEFLKVTPSAISKLNAAWDGLSTETQIKILEEINKGSFGEYFTDKVNLIALKSKNTYVRYLAAKGLKYSSEAKGLIENDPEPLVKYSLYETDDIAGLAPTRDPGIFFSLPHDARLAIVRSLTAWGRQIAAIISYAVDNCLKNGSVTEQELFEILLDYLNKKEYKARYEYESARKDINPYMDLKALWELVPKVPKRCSHVLILLLPVSVYDIPKEITDSLDNHQLKTLLEREDVKLEDLRKKFFWESVDAYKEKSEQIFSDDIPVAEAISHNFNLTYEEFDKILAKHEKQKIEILDKLTSANGLALCIYRAIYDIMLNSDVDMFSWEYAEFAKYPFERTLKKLKDYQLKKELLELRLYRLAKEIVPWKKEDGYKLGESLDFLNECVVKGDTWKTFMAFSKTWATNFKKNENLEKYLPNIDPSSTDFFAF